MSHAVTEDSAVADTTIRASGGPTTDREVTVWGTPAEAFAPGARRAARILPAGDDHHGVLRPAAPADTRRRGGR